MLQPRLAPWRSILNECLEIVFLSSFLCPYLSFSSFFTLILYIRSAFPYKRQLWVLHAAHQVPMVTGNLHKRVLAMHVTLSGSAGTREQPQHVNVLALCIRHQHGNKSCSVQVGDCVFISFFSLRWVFPLVKWLFSPLFLNNAFNLYMFIFFSLNNR